MRRSHHQERACCSVAVLVIRLRGTAVTLRRLCGVCSRGWQRRSVRCRDSSRAAATRGGRAGRSRRRPETQVRRATRTATRRNSAATHGHRPPLTSSGRSWRFAPAAIPDECGHLCYRQARSTASCAHLLRPRERVPWYAVGVCSSRPTGSSPTAAAWVAAAPQDACSPSTSASGLSWARQAWVSARCRPAPWSSAAGRVRHLDRRIGKVPAYRHNMAGLSAVNPREAS